MPFNPERDSHGMVHTRAINWLLLFSKCSLERSNSHLLQQDTVLFTIIGSDSSESLPCIWQGAFPRQFEFIFPKDSVKPWQMLSKNQYPLHFALFLTPRPPTDIT